jgi:hypothetical protein
MIRSESYNPSLYKPYFGLYKKGFSRSLDSFSLSILIYSCFDYYISSILASSIRCIVT